MYVYICRLLFEIRTYPHVHTHTGSFSPTVLQLACASKYVTDVPVSVLMCIMFPEQGCRGVAADQREVSPHQHLPQCLSQE